MSQDNEMNALTLEQVIDSISFLIKEGIAVDLLEKFAYLYLGKYDVLLNPEFLIPSVTGAEPKKDVLNGVVLKIKETGNQIYNATVVSLIYRSLNAISIENIGETIGDGKSFVRNINSIKYLLNGQGHGSCEGYAIYISDNPCQVLNVVSYARQKIQLSGESFKDITSQLNANFDKEKFYILVCRYSYNINCVGFNSPCNLYLETIDLKSE